MLTPSKNFFLRHGFFSGMESFEVFVTSKESGLAVLLIKLQREGSRRPKTAVALCLQKKSLPDIPFLIFQLRIWRRKTTAIKKWLNSWLPDANWWRPTWQNWKLMKPTTKRCNRNSSNCKKITKRESESKRLYWTMFANSRLFCLSFNRSRLPLSSNAFFSLVSFIGY